ncbi:RcnB family protein [Polaromonas sp. SM01]|uniref:RcnB family protein n=1 Tax=Polaromonas sp. SM01 TaxID=3085630 RepID=UPI002981783A|nr:RcnB family protein [Polaromonas sp. SM01]MDW5443413.1 RcnB family protein [Polaromonas sp. SM01]
MKNNTCVAALAAMTLALSGLAPAQGRDERPRQDNRPNEAQRAGPHQGRPGMHRGEQRGQERRAPEHAEGRGAGPDHNFHKGGRLLAGYRGHQYVVDDWRAHRLSAPPRGYRWVQTGADYVLVAIATGIIADILLGQ